MESIRERAPPKTKRALDLAAVKVSWVLFTVLPLLLSGWKLKRSLATRLLWNVIIMIALEVDGCFRIATSRPLILFCLWTLNLIHWKHKENMLLACKTEGRQGSIDPINKILTGLSTNVYQLFVLLIGLNPMPVKSFAKTKQNIQRARDHNDKHAWCKNIILKNKECFINSYPTIKKV